VRLPAGHGGGVDSGVFLTSWGYGGRRRSCDGEEGGKGEFDAPRTKNSERKARATLTVDVLMMAEAAGQRRSRLSDSDGRLQPGRRCGRDGRGGSDSGSGAVGTALSGRWRAVPTALLTCWSGAARGSHVKTTWCQVGPALCAASDRWDPLVSVFRIKNSP
jgi:hypothetical protein